MSVAIKKPAAAAAKVAPSPAAATGLPPKPRARPSADEGTNSVFPSKKPKKAADAPHPLEPEEEKVEQAPPPAAKPKAKAPAPQVEDEKKEPVIRAPKKPKVTAPPPPPEVEDEEMIEADEAAVMEGQHELDRYTMEQEDLVAQIEEVQPEPPAKKAKKPQLDVHAPAAAAATELPPAPVMEAVSKAQEEAPASSSLVHVPAASTAVAVIQPPIISPWLKPTEDHGVVELMLEEGRRLLPYMNQGRVRVSMPDLAVYLWSMTANKHVHFFEQHSPDRIITSRTEGKDSRKGEYYINFRSKIMQGSVLDTNPELYDDLGAIFGYRTLTPFGSAKYLKHGNTLETGIEGNRGREVKPGVIVEQGHESYGMQLSNQVYSPLLADEDDNNPVISFYAKAMSKTYEVLLKKVTRLDDSLGDMRKKMSKMCTSLGKAMPTDPDDVADALIQLGLVRSKVVTDESDPTYLGISCEAPCFRNARKAKSSGHKRAAKNGPSDETPLTHPPETPMFEQAYCKGTKTIDQFHRRIPVFRCRRWNEVDQSLSEAEKRKRYPSPFVLIPPDNAELDARKDVISEEYLLTFYESAMESSGFKQKQHVYIWLNDRESLNSMTEEDIVPCDPRFAVPMAGYYRGPKGWEGGAPPGWVEEPVAATAPAPAPTVYTNGQAGFVQQ